MLLPVEGQRLVASICMQTRGYSERMRTLAIEETSENVAIIGEYLQGVCFCCYYQKLCQRIMGAAQYRYIMCMCVHVCASNSVCL